MALHSLQTQAHSLPVELLRDNGHVLKMTSAPDGTFSYSVATHEGESPSATAG